MNNNIFFGQDGSMYQQFQQMMQQQSVDYYSKLEKELQSMSDMEVQELANFKPYVESNNALSVFIQAALVNLVRKDINGQPEIIQKVIDSIKLFKENKSKERLDFEDYIKNYSDITYKEYKQLKYEKG